MSTKKFQYKVSEKNLKWIEADPPYPKRCFKTFFGPISDECKAWMFIERFEAGAESYPHYHTPPQIEIFYGMKGTGICELVSQDQKYHEKLVINPGDAIYCPENWTHKIKNASDKEEWVVFCIVFPA